MDSLKEILPNNDKSHFQNSICKGSEWFSAAQSMTAKFQKENNVLNLSLLDTKFLVFMAFIWECFT